MRSGPAHHLVFDHQRCGGRVEMAHLARLCDQRARHRDHRQSGHAVRLRGLTGFALQPLLLYGLFFLQLLLFGFGSEAGTPQEKGDHETCHRLHNAGGHISGPRLCPDLREHHNPNDAKRNRKIPQQNLFYHRIPPVSSAFPNPRYVTPSLCGFHLLTGPPGRCT